MEDGIAEGEKETSLTTLFNIGDTCEFTMPEANIVFFWEEGSN